MSGGTPCNGFVLRRAGEWSVLTEERERPDSALGRPGPWKAGPSGPPGPGSRRGTRWSFELPPGSLAGDCDSDLGGDAVAVGGSDDAGVRPPSAALLAWAESTARGEVPAGWQAPGRDEVVRWLGGRRLVAGSGAGVVLGVLACEPERLALGFPRLVRLPAGLSRSRRAWVAALSSAVEEHWRLVRCAPDGAGHVAAEVDLTGVPPALAPKLVRLSLEALLCAVEWVLPSLHVVVDPDVPSHLLDRIPRRARPAQPIRIHR